MNTQTHVLIGWLAAKGLVSSKLINDSKVMAPIWIAAIVGGLFPDLSLIVMVAVESALGTPMQQIWDVSYFSEPWISVDAVFNSLPLYLAIFLITWRLKLWWAMAFGLAASLHVVLDLPVHASDAHAHFWPISMWKFESPLSYWETGKGAQVISVIELIIGLVGCAWLWRVIPHWQWQWRIVILLLLMIYLLFAALGIWFAISGAPWEQG